MRAGIGPLMEDTAWECKRLPRASGDRPFFSEEEKRAKLVAPCERG